jgi:hypothetical protein
VYALGSICAVAKGAVLTYLEEQRPGASSGSFPQLFICVIVSMKILVTGAAGFIGFHVPSGLTIGERRLRAWTI